MARTEQDWYAWHAPYDRLDSVETGRLEHVQEAISATLDAAPPGRLSAVSACSGQARDLLPVLIDHPRGRDIDALLIELEPLNASFLHGALGSTALTSVEVLVADAGAAASYAGHVPADLLLMCGVFANIDLKAALRTIGRLDELVAPAGSVVWTTYGDSIDDADDVLAAFAAAGFAPVSLVWAADRSWLVSVHRFDGESRPWSDEGVLFAFRPSPEL
ncbi:SAM-dependent methyltransferase [Streptomyces sp. NBC_01476]|uniref:SAM-dependent methyltransferase n=1 Tax=Streptomyces sp. NBC_01476 TaxID=2903881 RepID=UPI002E2F30B9|nr:SAM-dependent methyltransferase [Streptomyces sp. NBC_01476]